MIDTKNHKNLKISFDNITGSDEQIEVLYTQLKNRKYDISHKFLPQFEDHIKFVKNNSEINYGPIYVLIGGPLLFIGYRLQSERVTHWFEGLINGMFQFCGFLLIATGMFFLSYGIFLLKSKSKVES